MTARPPLTVTPYQLGQRFLGLHEVPGTTANPAILAMLQLDSAWPTDDAVPWCSAWLNTVCHLLGLDRSKSLRARSWLRVGTPLDLAAAEPGFDVVILNRGGVADPTVIDAPGHVGFFDHRDGDLVRVLGGNQGNQVSVAPFPAADVLGVRRL